VMAVLAGPGDRLLLGLEGAERVVGVILDHEVLDRAALRPALRSRLDVDRVSRFLPGLNVHPRSGSDA
jgi:hypothetical protein